MREIDAGRVEIVVASRSLEMHFHFWSDSHVVLKSIASSDRHLPHFVKRQVGKIVLVASADA